MQSRYITQNPQYKNCTKIRPVGAKLFKADIYVYIQGVTGGTDQTSGECSLGHTIPI